MNKKNKKGAGRPVKEINKDQLLKLAQLGCKTVELADFFDVSVDTLDNNYSDILLKGRAELKMSLRQWQLSAAKKGNATMLVWLGKQMLSQTDVIDQDANNNLTIKLAYNDE